MSESNQVSLVLQVNKALNSLIRALLELDLAGSNTEETLPFGILLVFDRFFTCRGFFFYLFPLNNTTSCQIVRREFNRDLITLEYSNIVLLHLAGQMTCHGMIIVNQLNLKDPF